MTRNDINIGQIWMIKGEDNPKRWKKGIQEKTRPMLVIAIHGANCNCVPITSSELAKDYNKIVHELPNNDILLLTQIRTISKVDFISYMYSISPEELMNINMMIAHMFMTPSTNWKHPVSKKPPEGKIDQKGSKVIPVKIKEGIIKDFSEMPMMELLKRYRSYNINKQDVYNIILSSF